MVTGHIFPISEKFSGFMKKWSALRTRAKQMHEIFNSFADVVSQLKEAAPEKEASTTTVDVSTVEAVPKTETLPKIETLPQIEIEATAECGETTTTKIEDHTRRPTTTPPPAAVAHPEKEISESAAYPWKQNKKRDTCYDYQQFLKHKKRFGIDLRHSLHAGYCYSLLSEFFGTQSETTSTKSMRLPEVCVNYIPVFVKNEGVEEEYFVVDNEIHAHVEAAGRQEVVDLDEVELEDVVDSEESSEQVKDKEEEAEVKEEEEEGLDKLEEKKKAWCKSKTRRKSKTKRKNWRTS